MTTARRTKKTIVNASNAAEIERMLRIPRRTVAAFDSPAKVRQAFSLPVTLGAQRYGNQDCRSHAAQVVAFAPTVAFETIVQLLEKKRVGVCKL